MEKCGMVLLMTSLRVRWGGSCRDSYLAKKGMEMHKYSLGRESRNCLYFCLFEWFCHRFVLF